MITSQRPKGITFLARLAILGGAINLLSILGGNFLGLFGILNLIFGFGALKLKPWAWLYGTVIYGIGILAGFINIMFAISQQATAVIPIGCIQIAISGLILWYLYTPKVRRAFGKA